MLVLQRRFSSSRVIALAALVRLFPACSGSDEAKDEATENEEVGPMAEDGDWHALIRGDWTVAPGTEDYTCVRHTVEEDLFVTGFEALNPPGTHHTLLTMGDPNGPDGTFACGAGDNFTLGVFGSGVGTDPVRLPDGVALKIPRGKQLMLNLHLFNTGGEDLSGSSGTRIRTIEESEVEHLADGLLGGPIFLDIPAGTTTEHVGWCTMKTEVTIFAVSPHMHQLGVHEKIVAESSVEGERVLHDGPYDFNEQSFYSIDPIRLLAGDKVRVECTHHNPTDRDVKFGESSLDEMCLAGLYRYPADGSLFFCSDEIDGFTQPEL